MSDTSRNYELGKLDGGNRNYDPPHDKPFILELIEGWSDKEIEENQAYRHGYDAGKK